MNPREWSPFGGNSTWETSTCIPISMSKNKKRDKKIKMQKHLSTKVRKINGHGVVSCTGGVSSCAGDSTGIDGVGSCAGSSTGISGVGLLKKSSSFGTPILLRHLVTARVGLQRA
ncbi:hypothetical protein TNCT_129901 [Trichonephila clavata]|uniref:Uncharacterized protein n=1 Tax=Trichonephila clavata TaxID=2740835 RepID=A0A8X6FP05_TRICU|nr:hypothetical protein TNCT_129901 [Trichonephila clavata]